MNYHDLSLSLTEALIRSELGREQKDTPGGKRPEERRPPFTITISREAGALGNSVASEIGARLNWPVYDRNILEKIAEELGRSPTQLEGVDERPVPWLEECLACLFDRYHVGSDAYVKHLFAAVRGLGAQGRCVLVGRGANFILSPESTLRVRLIAMPQDRIQVIAKKLGLSNAEADLWIKTTERERTGFIKRTFNEDPSNPHHYDLVLNMSRLSVSDAADIILETLRHLEAQAATVAPKQRAANPAFA